MNINRTKKQLITLVTELSEEYSLSYDEQILEKIRQELQDFLSEHPNDVDILLTYALFYYEVCQEDYPNAVDFSEKVLSIDPLNPFALLILAYIENYDLGKISDELFQKLLLLKEDDPIVASAIEIGKAWYYYDPDKPDNKSYRECLEKSVFYNPILIKSNYTLGEYHYYQRDYDKASCHFKNAYKGIHKVPQKIPYLPSPKQFLDQRYFDVYNEKEMKRWIEEYLEDIAKQELSQ